MVWEMLESGMTFDYGQLVMDNEFAKMIKHVVMGIPVNDETLSVDVIKEVGPFKDFLSHKNTFQNMKIQSSPRLMDRRVRAQWEAAGCPTLYDRAVAEAQTSNGDNTIPNPFRLKLPLELRRIVEETEKGTWNPPCGRRHLPYNRHGRTVF